MVSKTFIHTQCACGHTSKTRRDVDMDRGWERGLTPHACPHFRVNLDVKTNNSWWLSGPPDEVEVKMKATCLSCNSETNMFHSWRTSISTGVDQGSLTCSNPQCGARLGVCADHCAHGGVKTGVWTAAAALTGGALGAVGAAAAAATEVAVSGLAVVATAESAALTCAASSAWATLAVKLGTGGDGRMAHVSSKPELCGGARDGDGDDSLPEKKPSGEENQQANNSATDRPNSATTAECKQTLRQIKNTPQKGSNTAGFEAPVRVGDFKTPLRNQPKGQTKEPGLTNHSRKRSKKMKK